ncbi:DUF4870 domain-containing protein [Candidatus Peregrinibacteria bacterium]|nr:DUF4870 domain-containing protein [Candidatus Peregrinibacteria bacterium]
MSSHGQSTNAATSIGAAAGSPPKPGANQSLALAIIGYILPFLFFLPLVTDAKKDAFARYHANQQLLLLLFWIAGHVISGMLVMVFIGILLFPLVSLATLVFIILGIINVVNGKMAPLPLIGQFTLIR